MSTISTDRSVRALLRQGVEQLRASAVPSYTLAAELLLLHVAARDRTWLYAHPEETLPGEAAEKYSELLQRRGLGEPTQHLTGKQEFWGLEFEVNPQVLIPRPETEHLIEVALDRLAVRELREGRSAKLTGEGLTIVDVGTGSGCIAAALAKELSAATIYAGDVSPAALEVAKCNAVRLGFGERIRFVDSNLFDGFRTVASGARRAAPLLFDLVISNLPYIGRRDADALPIEVREHEPSVALYGGEEGYELYGRLIPEAAEFLKPGGLLVLELGYNSLPAVQPLLVATQWSKIAVTNDLAGIPRVLSAERAAVLLENS